MAEFASLRDRVAVVTGGGQGLGRTFVKALAQHGAVAAGRRAAKVADEICKEGARALGIKTDVGSVTSVNAMSQHIYDKYGRIDALINNAAIFSTLRMRPFQDIPLDEWDRVLDINVTGAFRCARAVCGAMIRAGWGRIVNVSSASIKEGRANYLHYTTSKAALIGMTRSIARELGKSGITVNALLPGATVTEIRRETISPAQMQEVVARRCIPREGNAGDLVGTRLFLCSDHAAFMTGQSVTVDEGMTHSL